MTSFRVLGLGTILTLLCLINAACGDEEDETNTQTETESNMGRTGPEGCYIPGNMLCDCAIEEVDCTMDVGVWTAGCESCTE
jgi:hypothetical protein